MKKLCMITPFFPPTGGSAVQRVYKHLKYLRLFNWDTVVITRPSSIFYAFDESLLDEIPKNVKVYRTFSLDYGAIKTLFHKNKRMVEDRRWTPYSIKKVSISNIIRKFFLIPDGYILWLPFALARALRLARKIDAYYLRTPAFSTGLLAPALRFFTGKPIITDFSDEWMCNCIDNLLKPKWRKRIERLMERMVIGASTWVAFSTEASKAYYSSHYPNEAHKFRVIFNGYDEDDFSGFKISGRANKKLVVVYSGNCENTLKPGNLTVTPYYFLKALNLLKLREIELEKTLQVKFIGYVGRDTKQYIGDFGLQRVVTFLGNRSHKEAIEGILSADILLLLLFSAGRGSRVIPAKLFEYLRARKPILALASDDSEVAKLIKRYNAGRVVHPESPKQIADALSFFLRLHKEGRLASWNFSAEPIEKFTRAESSRRLAEILEEKI